MTTQESGYRLDSSSSASSVMERLGQEFAVRRRELPARRQTAWDTFDGRLTRRGLVLWSRQDGDRTRLVCRLADGEAELEGTAEIAPAFGSELPGGRLREELGPILDVRRLLPEVEVETHGSGLDVLDGAGKTVARVQVEEGRARRAANGRTWCPMETLLRVVPLRGYPAAHHEVVAALARTPGVVRNEADLHGTALEAVGLTPRSDPSSVRAELDPDMRADVGLKRIHHVLLDVVRANEAGTRADLDPEFLHDFRVSTRKARSLLGQVREVFPAEAVERAREGFSWLGDVTNEKRDMDVFLLQLDDLETGLGDVSLQPLREWLRGRQLAAQEKVVAGLGSSRYRAFVGSWQAFLEEPVPEEPPADNAGRPLLDVVGARISRIHARLLEKGSAIPDDAPPKALHDLRLRCKKLRYLIDTTRSLHDAEVVNGLVREMRRLQDLLGEFNDLGVQRTTLVECARLMAAEGSADADTLLALGRIVERLRRRAQRTRRRFADRFAVFASPPVQGLFEALLRPYRQRVVAP